MKQNNNKVNSEKIELKIVELKHAVNIVDAHNHFFAEIRTHFLGEPIYNPIEAKAKANANFIVTACNNHYKLIEALNG
jgi:hypothetical protein